MAEHLVVYGGGAQALYHTPIDRLGRPTRVTSATYSIVDLREGITSSERVVASGSATVDAVSTTLAADAGPSTAYPRRLTVTSGTGIVEGRTYLLSKADGRRETVTVAGITGVTVQGSYPIRGEYTTGDTFRGVTLSCEFPLSEANDEDETVKDPSHPGYQVIWTYEIDGKDYLVGEMVRVSRYSIQPWIRAEDIIRGYPDAASRSKDVESAISCACEDIQAEVEGSGRDFSLFRGGNSLMVVTRLLALHYITSWMHGDDDREMSDRFFARYKDAIHVMFQAGTPPRDVKVLDQASDEVAQDPFADLFVRG